MSLPRLVESHVKTVLNYNLNECHEIKTNMNSENRNQNQEGEAATVNES